jgi:hypothetical protein
MQQRKWKWAEVRLNPRLETKGREVDSGFPTNTQFRVKVCVRVDIGIHVNV